MGLYCLYQFSSASKHSSLIHAAIRNIKYIRIELSISLYKGSQSAMVVVEELTLIEAWEYLVVVGEEDVSGKVRFVNRSDQQDVKEVVIGATRIMADN